MSETPSQPLRRIAQVAVPVVNLQRATTFYRDTLGLRPMFAAPSIAMFECGGVRIALSAGESPSTNPPGSIVYFGVDDIRSAYEDLQSRGVEFIRDPEVVGTTGPREHWMAFFHDTEGNVLAIAGEREIPI
jgi:predicted enzyme related to lactoylglutathione lyase